jgi:D-glycero-D-manno-heptose 1,7-bisphosphate phosphatase
MTDYDRYVLLDRDGVINALPADVYILDPGELTLIDGAAEAIRTLNDRGYGILVVSNQQCVGKGLITREALDAISDRLTSLLREASGATIVDFFYCPHLVEDGCDCRKPKPGLIEQARARYGFDPKTTCMAGDSYKDVYAAQAAGCPSIFVRTGNDAPLYASGELPDPLPDFVAKDLLEAVAFILGRG